ncbi:MAG: hypothetical protein RL129_68 [Actinomycetota bacterium]|jgi:hypothetical protein
MPVNFENIANEIRAIKSRNEIVLTEVPAPQKLAPFAMALSAEVTEITATGRFVLLHDPKGQEGWGGEFRCVTFIRSAIDTEMANDPVLCDLGWSYLIDSLGKNDAKFSNPSGTVTKVSSASFGTLKGQVESNELEIRASWTPDIPDKLVNHTKAWLETIEIACGLMPIPAGVTQLSHNN